MDGSGDLYGPAGGGEYSKGILFELVRDKSIWKFRTIYNFCVLGNCQGGAEPSDLIMARSGELYGVASQGGAANAGTVFKLVRARAEWRLSVLYSFCRREHFSDGRLPATITLGPDGNLFGTTQLGGDYGGDGAGVAFALRAR